MEHSFSCDVIAVVVLEVHQLVSVLLLLFLSFLILHNIFDFSKEHFALMALMKNARTQKIVAQFQLVMVAVLGLIF